MRRMGRDATPIAAGRHVTFRPGPEILEGMDATGRARQLSSNATGTWTGCGR
jgi:hypothetical protein